MHSFQCTLHFLDSKDVLMSAYNDKKKFKQIETAIKNVEFDGISVSLMKNNKDTIKFDKRIVRLLFMNLRSDVYINL